MKITVGSLLTAFLLLNLFQTYQYKLGIIHGDRMTKAYYFRTFGKLEKTNEDQKLLMFDRDAAYSSKEIDQKHYRKSTSNQNFESIKQFITSNSHSGKKAEILSEENPYSKGVAVKYCDITNKDHVWIKVSAWVYSEVENASQQFYLIAHADHKGKAYQYEALNSKTLDIPVGKWTKISFNYLTPPIRRPYDEIKSSIWFQEGSGILLDDLTMEVWEEK